jgi:predicted lipoprotein
MPMKSAPLRILLLSISLVLAVTLSGCVFATVRTIKEDEQAKEGFNAENYVSSIWDSQVLPAYEQQAQDITTLLALVDSDEASAISQYGHRSGTGPYSFMVKGEARVVTFDTTSRAGLLTLDLIPPDGAPDGTPDVSMAVGPLVKISQRAAVRDAVGFIEYGKFVNQQEFAAVANAMGDRIIVMIAAALGADTVDAIRDIPPANLEGKTISFIGAISLEDRANIIIVPIELKVLD